MSLSNINWIASYGFLSTWLSVRIFDQPPCSWPSPDSFNTNIHANPTSPRSDQGKIDFPVRTFKTSRFTWYSLKIIWHTSIPDPTWLYSVQNKTYHAIIQLKSLDTHNIFTTEFKTRKRHLGQDIGSWNLDATWIVGISVLATSSLIKWHLTSIIYSELEFAMGLSYVQAGKLL